VAVQLEDYRAGGIPVVISTSIPTIISLAFSVQFQAGVNTSVVQDAIRSAVFSYVNTLGVNQTLGVADLYAVLLRFRAAGAIVAKQSILQPTGDVVPQVGQTLRTLLSSVTVNGS
jgi:hypothetical protein